MTLDDYWTEDLIKETKVYTELTEVQLSTSPMRLPSGLVGLDVKTSAGL